MSPAAVQTSIGFLPREEFQSLLDLLRQDGRTIIGPTVADGAIVYDEIESVADLPAGWGDEQAPGRYRLHRRDDERLFDYAVGPTSWKRFTFPPTLPLTVARRSPDGSVSFAEAPREISKVAFLGVRACELAALGIQDRVFMGGPYTDADYRARREAAFVVAVQCVAPASTCFCTSMGTGPEVRSGHDISLIELDEGFLVAAGTPAGSAVMERLPLREPAANQLGTASAALGAARERLGDPVAATGLHDRLLAKLDSPRWAEVAERCLACTNCTMACPTCFCNSIAQRSDLAGEEARRERVWDSCFTLNFARVAGGNFRPRVEDRYRQWLTHKFATWFDQFGSSGCVGCGRCITWCPVGIDVREELMAIAPPPSAPLVLPETPRLIAEPRESNVMHVVWASVETPDTNTLALQGADGTALRGQPGQFAMVALPAIGSLPISISRFDEDAIELTIRGAGPATITMASLQPPEEIGAIGPLGKGWPVDAARGHDVVVVAGGIGLAPLRPLIDAVLADRASFGAFRLYYGARTPADLLFTDELAAWAAREDMEVAVTVDRADASWLGRVGVVTHLFDRATWDGTQAIAYVCGPERMMQVTVRTLAARGLTPDRTYVSLERHMECGVGLCGHCQMGPFFVCRDGPVFSLAQLGDTFGREGI